jgi:hypothetical protein
VLLILQDSAANELEESFDAIDVVTKAHDTHCPLRFRLGMNCARLLVSIIHGHSFVTVACERILGRGYSHC